MSCSTSSIVILDLALLHAYRAPRLLGVPVSTLRLSLCIWRGKSSIGLLGSADWQGECCRVKCYVLWMHFENLKIKAACIVKNTEKFGKRRKSVGPAGNWFWFCSVLLMASTSWGKIFPFTHVLLSDYQGFFSLCLYYH